MESGKKVRAFVNVAVLDDENQAHNKIKIYCFATWLR